MGAQEVTNFLKKKKSQPQTDRTAQQFDSVYADMPLHRLQLKEIFRDVYLPPAMSI